MGQATPNIRFAFELLREGKNVSREYRISVTYILALLKRLVLRGKIAEYFDRDLGMPVSDRLAQRNVVVPHRSCILENNFPGKSLLMHLH